MALEDPFRQLRRDRAVIKIIVAGQDVSSRSDPRLLSVIVIDKRSGISEATIELDDRYGQIRIPKESEKIQIELGWPNEGMFTVFDGTASDIESAGQKRAGRTLMIVALGTDLLSKVKEPMRWSVGDGTEDKSLGDAMKKAAGLAGMTIKIDPDLSKRMRKYWMSNNESFMALGQRMAQEHGGIFSISGNRATLTKGDSPTDADGAGLTNTLARAGFNLIAWRIKPMESRPQWSNTGHMHFDPAKAAWALVSKAVGGKAPFGNAKADHTGHAPVADKANAEQQSDGSAVNSMRQRGTGWCVIDGEPQARAGGSLQLEGARDAVDGTYTIDEAEHSYNSQTGYTTRLTLEQAGSVNPRTLKEMQAQNKAAGQ